MKLESGEVKIEEAQLPELRHHCQVSKGVRNNLARWLKGVRKKEEGGEEGWVR